MRVSAADQPWLGAYPQGVPADIEGPAFASLADMMADSFARHAERTAYRFMGRHFSYRDIDQWSLALAAHLQAQGVQRGDRVALMMPNVPQYPVAVAAVLRAGGVVVNINPLYTPRELAHQLQDAGARAIVIFENYAATLEHCLADTPVRHVVLCAMGDLLGWPRGAIVNSVVRRVRKLVPPFELPGMVRFKDALTRGARLSLQPVALGPDAVALLQYTGGTTGVSKGAVLLHRQLLANVLQCEAWYAPALRQIPTHEQPANVCLLPLHHIFAFTVNMLLGLRQGGVTLLVPNPRDLPALFKELAQAPFHLLPAVNTLFSAMLAHPGFDSVDWRSLKVVLGGGMAVQSAVAARWLQRTGCPICEGYGLTETSPTVSCNPVDSTAFNGSIGLPLPGTHMKCIDDAGHEVPQGQPGEIIIRGPQVMAGYWQRPDETAKVMTPDGWFKTGDIGVMDAQGYFHIVDRKKDMILISGFNVYPNEVEQEVARHPGVLECAAVGMADADSGEAVRLIVVPRDPSLTEDALREHCRGRLTPYKQPRVIEFRTELPKTPVGKILRRQLRDDA